MTAPGNSAIHHAGGDVSVVVLDGAIRSTPSSERAKRVDR
jgi:hypothetical protein